MAEDDDAAPWLTIDEAATRRGTTVDAIRGLIRRGRIESRKDNEGRVRIRLPTVERLGATRRTTSRGLADDEARLGDNQRPTDHWRTVAEERAVALARAEGEAAGMRMMVEELRARAETLQQALEHERARAERLETERQRPWWRRLLG